MCRDGVFGMNGSLSLAARMRKTVIDVNKNQNNVCSVDATMLTEGQCGHTGDGRHYDYVILDKELDAVADCAMELLHP